MKHPRNLHQVLRHHLAGGSFEYLTYNHKLASIEYRQTREFKDRCEYFTYGTTKPENVKIYKYDIPEEIRTKYAYWRKGKIRRLFFNNDGSVNRIYIGAHWSRSFYNFNLKELSLINEKPIVTKVPKYLKDKQTKLTFRKTKLK